MAEDLIITQKRGWRWYTLWALLAITVVVSAFYVGRYDGRSERLELTTERDALQLQVDDDKMRISDLEQQTVMLQSSAQVDAQANEQIIDNIGTLQSTIDNLETELSFYRGLMAPEKDVKGLQVSDLRIEPTREQSSYRFQLVLSQVKEHKVFLKGSSNVTLKGMLNGKPTQYSLAEVSDMSAKDLRFTFKYFQNITGQLTLPEGFEPQSIDISATTNERKPQTATKSFEWLAAMR